MSSPCKRACTHKINSLPGSVVFVYTRFSFLLLKNMGVVLHKNFEFLFKFQTLNTCFYLTKNFNYFPEFPFFTKVSPSLFKNYFLFFYSLLYRYALLLFQLVFFYFRFSVWVFRFLLSVRTVQHLANAQQ